MVKMIRLKDNADWLEHRKGKIGGSDCASILGMNPYKSNVELWREKAGLAIPEDISDKPYVKYGHDAEPHLRALFGLDFPEYQIYYKENNMWLNDRFPWAHASLDGWLMDKDGRKGILEIKTTNILRGAMNDKWAERIPDNYYLQVLHYLAVTEFEFVVLKAQLKSEIEGNVFLRTKHYTIERKEVEEDISYLMDAERKFWESLKAGIEPGLILPEI